MANVEECRKALTRLADSLMQLEPHVRAKHVPRRTVMCTVSDLDAVFIGRVDEHGVHDLALTNGRAPSADVKVVVSSTDLLALADGDDDVLHAWLKGRIQVSAPVRDMLRLRAFFGM